MSSFSIIRAWSEHSHWGSATPVNINIYMVAATGGAGVVLGNDSTHSDQPLPQILISEEMPQNSSNFVGATQNLSHPFPSFSHFSRFIIFARAAIT